MIVESILWVDNEIANRICVLNVRYLRELVPPF